MSKKEHTPNNLCYDTGSQLDSACYKAISSSCKDSRTAGDSPYHRGRRLKLQEGSSGVSTKRGFRKTQRNYLWNRIRVAVRGLCMINAADSNIAEW